MGFLGERAEPRRSLPSKLGGDLLFGSESFLCVCEFGLGQLECTVRVSPCLSKGCDGDPVLFQEGQETFDQWFVGVHFVFPLRRFFM